MKCTQKNQGENICMLKKMPQQTSQISFSLKENKKCPEAIVCKTLSAYFVFWATLF
jgi:hypothetical protein